MKSLFANFLITMDLISCRLGKSLLVVLLLTIGFLLSGMTLLCVNITDYDRIQYQKKCDISRTGCMANENGISYEMPDTSQLDYEKTVDLLTRQQPHQQFYNQLKRSGLLEKCAQYSILGNTIGNSDENQDIVNFQADHQISHYANMGYVEYIQAQKDIFDIYGIKVEAKVKPEDWHAYDIILGSKFKEKYKNVEYIDFKEEKHRLLGFTEANQKLPFEQIAYKDGTALTGLYNLDYAFFQLYPEDTYSGREIHFRLAKGVSREEFKNKAEEMAAEKNATIETTYFIDDHLAELKENNLDILGPIDEFAVVLLLGISLICIFAKVYSILGNKRLYGILYSSGLSTNQINSLFVIENVTILLFSLILAYLCLYHGIYIFCSIFGAQQPQLIVDVVKSVLVSKVFLQEFLICFSMIVLASGIPMIIFSHLSPLSMMRDFYE